MKEFKRKSAALIILTVVTALDNSSEDKEYSRLSLNNS